MRWSLTYNNNRRSSEDPLFEVLDVQPGFSVRYEKRYRDQLWIWVNEGAMVGDQIWMHENIAFHIRYEFRNDEQIIHFKRLS